MRVARILPFAALALVACAGQPPAEPWQRPDGTPTTATDTSYCRQEGRRQANILYPGAPPNDARGLPRTTDARNFPAEVRFYEQCMTRLGYVRANTAPAR
ncbi:MAG TPA: hypothetical protein VKY24_22755 [Reyranella sp.]|jgi:hypothetical protein|nr:hypothetical protein [Reyranella sp.]